jgi:hypothetical protein
MAHATPPPQASTGIKTSGYCKLDYGHRVCFPGPVVADGEEVIPRWCFCPCHRTGAFR